MRTAAAQREALATVGSTMNILVRVGQREHRIERTHLPEPELIQAAVMLRPVVFLQKEPVQSHALTQSTKIDGAFGLRGSADSCEPLE